MVKLLQSFPSKRQLSADIEVYSNYFLFGFMDMETDEYGYLELSPEAGFEPSDLSRILIDNTIIGFNILRYDLPLLWLAYAAPFTSELKAASDDLILNDMRSDQLRQKYGFRSYETDAIDLMEVAPLKGSPKTYAARLHTPHLQDLPYSPHKALTREEALEVRSYNRKDLANNKLLWVELKEPLELRRSLSQQYQIDLRSKSDAQIAEAVIAKELQNITGKRPKPPQLETSYSFFYKAPEFISFKTPMLQEALRSIEYAKILLDVQGSPILPEEIAKLRIKIAHKEYVMGIGGLHSKDENQSVLAGENLLMDVDVASYYPNIILNCNLYPKHLGEPFLAVYRTLVERRLAAKAAKRKVEADGIKITTNGTFGKLGSPYSIFYSPDLLIQVTLTGQLALLMLIEWLAEARILVVSANTDGILIRATREQEPSLRSILKAWEEATGFPTEETPYRAFYARDVNNYCVLKTDGTIKVKGVYSEVGSALNSALSKNPENLICLDAMKALISNGTPIEETIGVCKDIRRFVSVRAVKGGAVWKGQYLGRVVRWYLANGEYENIHYASNGNRVPKTEGARPCMDLPTELPFDIDYARYIAMTREMLEDVRYYEPVRQRGLFE